MKNVNNKEVKNILTHKQNNKTENDYIPANPGKTEKWNQHTYNKQLIINTYQYLQWNQIILQEIYTPN